MPKREGSLYKQFEDFRSKPSPSIWMVLETIPRNGEIFQDRTSRDRTCNSSRKRI
ncbi:MAG: hypothetical protein KBF76_02850 [Verrucomicrobiales bacterium]|nr:hypothetical protein [Verrucomicrobiales bacterium]